MTHSKKHRERQAAMTIAAILAAAGTGCTKHPYLTRGDGVVVVHPKKDSSVEVCRMPTFVPQRDGTEPGDIAENEYNSEVYRTNERYFIECAQAAAEDWRNLPPPPELPAYPDVAALVAAAEQVKRAEEDKREAEDRVKEERTAIERERTAWIGVMDGVARGQPDVTVTSSAEAHGKGDATSEQSSSNKKSGGSKKAPKSTNTCPTAATNTCPATATTAK